MDASSLLGTLLAVSIAAVAGDGVTLIFGISGLVMFAFAMVLRAHAHKPRKPRNTAQVNRKIRAKSRR